MLVQWFQVLVGDRLLPQWRGHAVTSWGFGSALGKGAMCQQSGSVVWQGRRNAGIGSGLVLAQHKNRRLHVVPKMHRRLDHHKLMLWSLLGPGASY